MIDFRFAISNPFAKTTGRSQKDFVAWEPLITKNKALELQISRWPEAWEFFSLSIGTNWSHEDHAGPHIRLELCGFYFGFRMYDIRHWNFDEGRWETEEDRERDRLEWEAYENGQEN